MSSCPPGLDSSYFSCWKGIINYWNNMDERATNTGGCRARQLSSCSFSRQFVELPDEVASISSYELDAFLRDSL
eukprot:13945672-Ditylum_brightwellii.AAC.1